MDAYVETLYTEHNLSVSVIILMTGLSLAEVVSTLKRLELID